MQFLSYDLKTDMFQLSNLHFLAIVVVDIFVMAGLLRAARRHFNISLSVLAAATIFTLQLTAVIFFIGIPLNEINIHVRRNICHCLKYYSVSSLQQFPDSRTLDSSTPNGVHVCPRRGGLSGCLHYKFPFDK